MACRYCRRSYASDTRSDIPNFRNGFECVTADKTLEAGAVITVFPGLVPLATLDNYVVPVLWMKGGVVAGREATTSGSSGLRILSELILPPRLASGLN